MSPNAAMGFISKLFKSDPPSTDAEREPADVVPAEPAPPSPAVPISTPVVMPAYVPEEARPTPTDVYDRPTVLGTELSAQTARAQEEERPTMVAPEATAAALARAAAKPKAPSPPKPALPNAPSSKPSAPRPIARTESRPAPATPPPVPPPQAFVATTPRPAATRAGTNPKPPAPRASGAEVDRGFAGIQGRGTYAASPGTLETDLSDVRALFGQLATNHMRQVRDFMIELRWGSTPSTWVAVCEPSVESLRSAAEKVEFDALASGLHELATAMRSVDVTTTTMIEGDARDRILAAHDTLVGVLPDTFGLDGDRSQREAAILHALLAQIPDVRKVTIDKLYAAGLTTLETMLLATVEDLVATTNIQEIIAERIVERFQRYREEMASIAVDETRAHERARIGELVEQLRRQNQEFEQAATAWTEDAIQRKKDALLARGQTMLAVDLQLARLGEVALVRELERLPYARKVLKLDAFLAEADRAYATAPKANAVKPARG